LQSTKYATKIVYFSAVAVCAQQSQWLDVISRQQHGSYDVEMMQEEQEVLDYSYSE